MFVQNSDTQWKTNRFHFVIYPNKKKWNSVKPIKKTVCNLSYIVIYAKYGSLRSRIKKLVTLNWMYSMRNTLECSQEWKYAIVELNIIPILVYS